MTRCAVFSLCFLTKQQRANLIWLPRGISGTRCRSAPIALSFVFNDRALATPSSGESSSICLLITALIIRGPVQLQHRGAETSRLFSTLGRRPRSGPPRLRRPVRRPRRLLRRLVRLRELPLRQLLTVYGPCQAECFLDICSGLQFRFFCTRRGARLGECIAQPRGSAAAAALN